MSLLGYHVIKSWSKTQAVITKSSGEAELFGFVRGSIEGFGLISLCGGLGAVVKIRVRLDTSAAKGMVEREGIGKVRYVEVDELWIQAKQARARFPPIKVNGSRNPADFMTNHLARSEMIKKLGILCLIELEGRSEKAAQLHSVVSSIDELVERGSSGHDPDSWGSRGENGVWVRRHSTPRLSLFTPYRFPRGPSKGLALGLKRRTIGKLLNGDAFDVTDDHFVGSQAHRFLKDGWTGRTEFSVAPIAAAVV